MPRQPRLEYEGAIYHVINRGNYRRHVFSTDGAKEAFLRGLDETATKLGWRIHAWVVMSNHFHVALETPHGDLVQGMRTWQGTFGTRFNRLRTERGHIFQGRYKSLLVEGEDYLGSLCHYIHLNPIRARICTKEEIGDWPWSSIHWLFNPRKRPAWFEPATALGHAGRLADNKRGHRSYLEYLSFLAADPRAQREHKFNEMCRGWVLGSLSFKKSLIEQHEELNQNAKAMRQGIGAEIEALWETQLQELLKRSRRSENDLAQAPKSAGWKVELAAAMKAQTTATNQWLSDHLHMSGLHEVSRLVSRWKRDRANSR